MNYQATMADLMASAGIHFTDQCSPELVVSDLCSDSRHVSTGSLFCAYPGAQVDGRDFINQAIEQGAVAVLCEASEFELQEAPAVPIILVEGLQARIGHLADAFFAQPSDELQVFGVTGTNGKTTCCYLLAQALGRLGMQSRMIGTIGTGELHNLQTATHTTPDAIQLHRLLAQYRDEGATQVCVEVSSHALAQGRVAGVRFFCTLFTNLSHDHLDFHGDMASYAEAKKRLFTEFKSELVITNADDELGAQLVDIANSEFIASYGEAGDVRAESISLSVQGIELEIEANGVDFKVLSPLIGKVNVPNLLLLVTTLLALSVSIEDIKELVSSLEPAPGRMELYRVADSANAVIDYAHTPDALQKALQSVREHCRGQLWCVFGCGGDRDKAKRPTMGSVADKFADRIIITNDNPRSEDGAQIAGQIRQAVEATPVEIILDRAVAIKSALAAASGDDWVLIAGKGHESTQQIGTEYRHFSDREQVAQVLGIAA